MMYGPPTEESAVSKYLSGTCSRTWGGEYRQMRLDNEVNIRRDVRDFMDQIQYVSRQSFQCTETNLKESINGRFSRLVRVFALPENLNSLTKTSAIEQLQPPSSTDNPSQTTRYRTHFKPTRRHLNTTTASIIMAVDEGLEASLASVNKLQEPEQVILIRVGGTLFSLDERTIELFQSDFLNTLIDPESTFQKPEDGVYKVDANGECFSVFLHMVRYGSLPACIVVDNSKESALIFRRQTFGELRPRFKI
eukprot:scaffold36555_cov51-Attheya_sp.AAC.3